MAGEKVKGERQVGKLKRPPKLDHIRNNKNRRNGGGGKGIGGVG